MISNLSIYDNTMTYENLIEIDASKPTVKVDIFGNRDVLRRLHKRLSNSMKLYSNVGFTHSEMVTWALILFSRPVTCFSSLIISKNASTKTL